MTATATAEEAPAKGGKRTLLLLLVVLVALGGAGAAFLLLPGGDAEAEEAEGVEAEPEEGAVVAVAEMTANLAGPQAHFAKVSFAAVLSAEADEAAVSSRFPLLRDAAISELSTTSAEDLRTTAGMDDLRARLSARAAELYPDGEVLRVVLTELLVQ